jgi:hypothetical protein
MLLEIKLVKLHNFGDGDEEATKRIMFFDPEKIKNIMETDQGLIGDILRDWFVGVEFFKESQQEELLCSNSYSSEEGVG